MLNDKFTIPDLVYDLETIGNKQKINNQKSITKKKIKKILKKKPKNFLDAIDVITDSILYENNQGLKSIQIRQNRKVLGKIHHILHIADYKKPEFRKELLLRAEITKLIDFLKAVNLISETTNDLSSSEIVSLCEKASKLSWGNNPNTKSFVNIFDYDDNLIPLTKEIKENVEEITIVKKIKGTGKYVLTLYSDEPFRQLYPYQSRVFYKADTLIDKRLMKFIIQMPTGSGKTRVAMEIISHFLNRGIYEEKERQVIWLADREELLEQAIESFKSVFPHLGKKDAKLYRLWSKYKSSKFEKNSIIMANYQTLKIFVKDNPNLLNPDLVICDEAHNAIADTYKPLIEEFINKGSRLIGLTATPIRSMSGNKNNELKEFFSKRIIEVETDEDILDNPITFLQKKGYLSYVHKYKIDVEKIESSIPIDILKLASRARELPDLFLQILAEDNYRNEKIAKKLYEISKSKKRTLYFGTTIYQSQLMCAIMVFLGVNAVHIDGYTPVDYRRDCIKKFKNGEIDLICNCDMFTTGFDEPKIDVVVIGRPTKSIVLHQQMIGRGMRGPKMGGTKEFDLYRISDELPTIDLADSYFTEFWYE